MKNISGDNLQRIARELIDFNKLSAQLAAKEIRERHRRAGIVFFPNFERWNIYGPHVDNNLIITMNMW